MIYPSRKQFRKLARQGNLIPVYREILGDLETPVAAYLKLTQNSKYSFLLESVEGEEKVARFSFLAKDPEMIFKSKGRSVELIQVKKNRVTKNQFKTMDTPLSFLREIMSRYQFVSIDGLPRFCGGLVGYIGYDTVRFFEELPNITKDDLSLPDIVLVLAKNLLIFDHLTHKIKVVSCVDVPKGASKTRCALAYRHATREINRLVVQLQRPLRLKKKTRIKKPFRKTLKIRSNFSEAQFKKIVQEAKKDIRAGEIIQTVLSQRFKMKIRTDPLNIYRTLRSLNPSPYMYYLNFDEIRIIGSSPEMLVRCENGIVETRPIAGTRPRGASEKEDQALSQELLHDPKEKAEHIMLVDLGRNDLGRVCEQGTVKVSDFMLIERYSHVMHIVSNVVGTLKPQKDMFDVLAAAFPAGTVSGAPKIRAMEIIEKLERIKRGPYAGCIGYFGFSGNLDTCITIRTIVAKNNLAYIQAGAGIVADSNPRKEYFETINKAKAQIAAIELAHKHLE
ncbi:MAG: anthranilate synthase component I [Candidatus Omnitrophota bacterium]